MVRIASEHPSTFCTQSLLLRSKLAAAASALVAVVGAEPVAAAEKDVDAEAAEAAKPKDSSTKPAAPGASGLGARSPGVQRMAAARRTGRLVIDGLGNDEAWAGAAPQQGFWQRNPNEGTPPRFDTEFRVLYDDEALYIYVRAFDPEPGQIRGLLTRRDQDSASDWVSVAVDSYADRRTAFLFSLNPAGVQRDMLLYDDTNMDEGWDAVWEGATSVDGNGWAAEFKIPYGQLRFSTAEANAWGLQVSRLVQRTREESMWAPWPKESGQRVSLFGQLEGMERIVPPRRLELLPYASGGLAVAGGADGTSTEALTGLGLDVEYGLGSNFTLTGTINPDFGQVEADPSEVNLSAGESFFAEKRAFFLEGTDIFRFGIGQGDELLYSRRIGAAPHGSVDDVDGPSTTTIYGATKLSGKTSNGWSIGMLDAVTAEEHVAGTTVEPLTNYGVTRVTRSFNQGRTSMGGMLTTVHRALGGAEHETLRAELHDQAYAGGVGVEHRFARDLWQVSAKILGSYVHGSAAAITATQEASQRYFQRPDATHLEYDPTRTSLAGLGGTWQLSKIAGGNWRFSSGGDLRTPGFEINDLGFQRNADYYVHWLWLQRRDDQPGKVLQSWNVNWNGWFVWNSAPELMSQGANVNGSATFTNYWSVYGGSEVNNPFQDAYALRGGPAMRMDPENFSWLGGSSDSRKVVRAQLDANGWWNPSADSWRLSLSALASVQARSNLEISVGPQWMQRVANSQYVDQVADQTGNLHYILARIEQFTTALTVRLDYTFTPALSLQLYAQPFVSTGQYSRYKEVVQPQALGYDARFHEFEPGETRDQDGERAVDRNRDGSEDFRFSLADFDVRQLRSNLVLRWEYRPGSTVFFIWSHDRTSEAEDGRFQLGSELAALANTAGEHVFLFKLNHWFSV